MSNLPANKIYFLSRELKIVKFQNPAVEESP